MSEKTFANKSHLQTNYLGKIPQSARKEIVGELLYDSLLESCTHRTSTCLASNKDFHVHHVMLLYLAPIRCVGSLVENEISGSELFEGQFFRTTIELVRLKKERSLLVSKEKQNMIWL